MTLYGFIVLAFLLIPDHAPIPFATMEACEAAKSIFISRAHYRVSYKRRGLCVYTGAPR